MAGINNMSVQNASFKNQNYTSSLKPKVHYTEQEKLALKNYKSETSDLEFKVYPIRFAPEDEEKLKNMSLDEQIKYMSYLKSRGMYVVEKEPIIPKTVKLSDD